MIKRTARVNSLLHAIVLAATFLLILQGELRSEDSPSTTDKEAIATKTILDSSDRYLVCFAAMCAVGVSCLASAFALSRIGSAAMGAMSEKPEIGGRALIFLGLAEGIAIYGLIVAIIILGKI